MLSLTRRGVQQNGLESVKDDLNALLMSARHMSVLMSAGHMSVLMLAGHMSVLMSARHMSVCCNGVCSTHAVNPVERQGSIKRHEPPTDTAYV